jgi:hypothetical protein
LPAVGMAAEGKGDVMLGALGENIGIVSERDDR